MAWQQDLVGFIKSEFPNRSYVPLHEPQLSAVEKGFLSDCIDSGFVSSVGQYVQRFENEVAAYCGSRFGIATSNGTSALHLALIVAGVKPGDEVLTQALTFVATANAITYCSAEPVFIDSAEDNLGMSARVLREFLQKNTKFADGSCVNKTSGRVLRACVPMHVFGHAVEIEEIKNVCEEFRIALVEDAAEALGSRVKDKHLGGFGDLSVLSFNGNKIITTGGGGMILTDREDIALRAKHLSTTAKRPHPYEFYHDEIGFNYRLPNINAALGCAQVTKLPQLLVSKRQLALKYRDFVKDFGEISFVDEPEGTKSNFWLNAIMVENRATRDAFLEYSNANGVMTRPLWTLMTDLPSFTQCQRSDLKNAKQFVDRVVNIPSSGRV